MRAWSIRSRKGSQDFRGARSGRRGRFSCLIKALAITVGMFLLFDCEGSMEPVSWDDGAGSGSADDSSSIGDDSADSTGDDGVSGDGVDDGTGTSTNGGGIFEGASGFGAFTEGTSSASISEGRTSWQPTDENSSGVILNEDGALTLSSEAEILPAVWIANDDEGTVSRLDAETGREVGRYASVITGAHERNDPSRTAVDFRGDCWVANRFRETGMPGSVTKIASHIEDCIDRNGNGEIETSRDLNDNGIIEVGTEEYLDAEDECVLFTTETGGPGSIPRALAIAPDPRGNSGSGNAWVGLNYGENDNDQRSCMELDGETGAILRHVPLDLNPYGALASKYEQKVWFTNARWQGIGPRALPDNPPAIVAVDFVSGEAGERIEVQADEGCVGTYGLTIDSQSRIWVAGHECPRAFRYDPRTAEWFHVDYGEVGTSRGLVADVNGYVWVAHSGGCGEGNCGVISRFTVEGEDLEYFYLPEGNNTIGADLDAFGRVWVVNKSTNTASRIDPITGTIDEFPTGPGPYTYSDFTGHSLLLQFPRGFYRDVLVSCAESQWLHFEMSADIPEDTTIEVRVRVADTEEGLASASWLGPWYTTPANLQSPPGPVPDGAYLELEVSLQSLSPLGAVPTLHSLDFFYDCPLQ